MKHQMRYLLDSKLDIVDGVVEGNFRGQITAAVQLDVVDGEATVVFQICADFGFDCSTRDSSLGVVICAIVRLRRDGELLGTTRCVFLFAAQQIISLLGDVLEENRHDTLCFGGVKTAL